MRKLILVIALIVTCVPARAQRFVKVFDNIAALLAANPNDVHTNVFVAGYRTANDGGGGIFTYDRSSALLTNLGTIFPTISTGRWLRQYSGALNVLWFGATVTAGDNDTTPVVNAYSVLITQGGGVLEFPNGSYAYNLTISSDNISIVGLGAHDVNVNTTYGHRAWDATRPIIRVGDDTRIVNGTVIDGIAFFAQTGGTNCPGAVHFLGGSYASTMKNCGAISGADTIKFQAGTNWPCSLTRLYNVNLWEGTNSTIIADDTRSSDPNSYCTRNIMIGGQVNGSNTSGKAVRVIRGDLEFMGTQFDMADDHAGYSLNGGFMRFSNCTFENGSGDDAIVFDVVFDSEAIPADKALNRYAQGLYKILGQVRWTGTNGTVITSLPVNGTEGNYAFGSYYKPQLILPFYMGTVANPYDKVFSLDMGGTNGPIQIKRVDENDFSLSYVATNTTLDFGRDANSDIYAHIDSTITSTGGVRMRFFRQTSTTGFRALEIFRGNNSTDMSHQFNSYGDSFINGLVGNLGVGKNNPASTLDVGGTAQVDTSVTVGLPGETGVIEILSTNGTHTLALSLLSNGSLSVTNDGVLVDLLALNSLYGGTGTRFKSDDGTYKAVIFPPGATVTNLNINPTDLFLPYRSNSTTFGDSLLKLANTQTIELRTATQSPVFTLTTDSTSPGAGYLNSYLRDANGPAEVGVIAFSKAGVWGGAAGTRDGNIGFNTLHDNSSYNRLNIDGDTGIFTFFDNVGGATVDTIANSSGYAGGGTKYKVDNGTFIIPTNYVTIALSNPNTVVTTGNTNFWVAPAACTIKSVTGHLFVPSSSGSVTLELKKNGTTVLSSAATLTSGTTNVTASLSVTSVSAFDRLAGEVTGAGTTAYGAQLKIGYTTP